ncbi:hypothetical protein [Sphingomonas sp. UYEF23]|uniref:hypothetical protein n=1 Tax=Sphingomonas sp. UYEF23 TaxID=1756408 RepID=UPI0033995207
MRSQEPSREYGLSIAEQYIFSNLPRLVELEAGEVLTVGYSWNTISIAVERHFSPVITFVDPAVALMRGMARRVAIESDVARALTALARLRIWRSVGTIAPPATLFCGNELWDALAASGRLEPQSLIDRVHWAMGDPDECADTTAPEGTWRTMGRKPLPIARCRELVGRHHVQRRGNEPWLSGSMHGERLSVTTYARDDTFAIRMASPVRRGGKLHATYEVRSTMILPETLVDATIGRLVSTVIDEDVVNELAGEIIDARNATTTRRFRVMMGQRPPVFRQIEHAVAFMSEVEKLMPRANAISAMIDRAFDRH